MTDTRRRVKLYALNADRQWDDRGTGHVSSSYVDRLKGISLLVRAESDGEFIELFITFLRCVISVFNVFSQLRFPSFITSYDSICTTYMHMH